MKEKMTAIKGNKKILALLLSIVLIVTAFIPGTFAFVADETSPLLNTFIPGVFEKGDLKLTKEIEHPFSANYIIPQGVSFEYEVDLGASYAGYTLSGKNGEEDITVSFDASGKAKVNVFPGKDVVISGIAEGTDVTVTEAQDKAGFTAKDGISQETKTIVAGGVITVGFINVYEPSAAGAQDIALTGEKNITGREWQEGDSFTFELFEKDGDSYNSVLTKTTEYSATEPNFNKFDMSEYFDGVSFDKEGIYYFKVIEREHSVADVDRDLTEYYIAIEVGDSDMDGALEITGVSASPAPPATVSGNDIHVVFSSNAQPPVIDDVVWTFEAKKTVENLNVVNAEDERSAEGFDIVLKENGTEEEKQTDAAGTASFTRTFTKDDIGETFSFTLYEKAGEEEFVTYDEKEYSFVVTVALDNENKLYLTTDFAGDDDLDTQGSYASAPFKNVYDPAQPEIDDIEVCISIEKSIINKGTLKLGPENFKFVLEDENGEEAGKASTDRNGKACIDLVFTKDDAGKEFSYTLSEVNEGEEGMKYSSAEYGIKVSVVLSEGVLSAEVSKNDAVMDSIVCAFENIYDKDLGSVDGDKPEDDGEGEEGEEGGTTEPPTGDKTPLIWLAVCMFAAGVTLLIVTLRKKSFEK